MQDTSTVEDSAYIGQLTQDATQLKDTITRLTIWYHYDFARLFAAFVDQSVDDDGVVTISESEFESILWNIGTHFYIGTSMLLLKPFSNSDGVALWAVDYGMLTYKEVPSNQRYVDSYLLEGGWKKVYKENVKSVITGRVFTKILVWARG